ncbi:hypothetical protein BSKO_11014 [Bryopsis sp. KO-2023]|nr:hypothetical protein BSKO_00883 [Bryopsis sp. KO-2023]GMH43092.1 hypothetical protein BSKO_11014 [Bryopsis sp. KO-2023]
MRGPFGALSEHSTYTELREFVKHMKPEKIIPTVGVNGDDVEKKEASILKHFRNLVNETASKAKFIENMQRGSGQPKASMRKTVVNNPQLKCLKKHMEKMIAAVPNQTHVGKAVMKAVGKEDGEERFKSKSICWLRFAEAREARPPVQETDRNGFDPDIRAGHRQADAY